MLDKIKMKQLLGTFLCIFVVFNFYAVLAQESANVHIKDLGRIKGSFMTTRLGKKIFSFRGVRFAEPPVGKLRFQVRFIESCI